MADDIDLDNILEDDMIHALEGLDNFQPPQPEPKPEVQTQSDFVLDDDNIDQEQIEEHIEETVVSSESEIALDSSNIDNLANLLKELLNNKTIHITIRVE